MIALELSPLGVEALDDPACPPGIARTTLREIATANALFGGRAAAAFGADQLLAAVPGGTRLTLLDVGAGSGDIAESLRSRARRRDVHLDVIALDNNRTATALARAAGLQPLLAGASALPVRNAAVDLVLASQFLHHFTRPSAVALVREFDRIARLGVVLCEPRRSPVAAAGIWTAALLLRFHAVTRRDGVLSVRRSFTAPELAMLLREGGVRGVVRRRPGFRLVAWWRSRHADR